METIKCPNCGESIEITKALTGQLKHDIQTKYEAALKDVNVSHQCELKKAEEQAERKMKGLLEVEREKAVDEQIEQTQLLKDELKEKRKQLVEANKNELELRKQQQKLNEEKAAFELTVQRELDVQRNTIVEQASKRAVEEQQLKMREKDDQLESLTAQIAELKRRAEVSSQQATGEVLEVELQDTLQQIFPFDVFSEVKKGQRGGDILQQVRNAAGKECGIILWESKNTRDFARPWIDKLKKDQQDVNADIAVLVSTALPKEIENFGQSNDVWITDYKSAFGLATALRLHLIAVARQRLVSVGQDSMKDLIYEYVTGQEFAMHIKAIASSFAMMQEDLQTEKRAMTRIWKKREKQIQAVLSDISGMRGSIEGIAQKALPEVKTMSLEEVTEDDDF